MMKTTFAITVLVLMTQASFAQEAAEMNAAINSVAEIATEAVDMIDGQASTMSVLDGEDANTIQPVLYQSGSSTRNAIQGAIVESPAANMSQGQMVEPSSVISGEVMQSEPMYSDTTAMADGTVMADGTMMSEGTVISDGGMYSPAPMASSSDCGCGGTPAPAAAPVMTYSAPMAAPAAAPCCPAPRRGFFRTLFGR